MVVCRKKYVVFTHTQTYHRLGYTKSTERCDSEGLRILVNDVKCNVTSLHRNLELMNVIIPFCAHTKTQ